MTILDRPTVRDSYDAIVVGGSWAGLSAAMQLARARRRVLVLDTGQPRNRFALTSHGFFGQDGRTSADILDGGRAQVLAYSTAEFRHEQAVNASADGDAFLVCLASGATIRARRLILATGVIDELPDVAGLRERWGRTVLHCPYCHGYEVADTRLGVLGTGARSVHQACLLPDWSADVTLFTNGVVTIEHGQSVALAARGVRVDDRPVVALLGDAPVLTGILLGDGAVVELDALFIVPRTTVASPLAAQLGCAVDDSPFGPLLRTDASKETTVPGVFAAGDAARTPHNANFASGDGALAGMAAHRSLVYATSGTGG
ncbi:MAG: NAD(P)/FAD-dependent oxidoreductase [Gemmatimonadota bacterium]